MSDVAERSDACIWLSGVAWPDYIRLREIPENRNVRMTYDDGNLELMAPSKLHERIAELLARLIGIWTEERAIPVQSCGSMTFRHEDLQRGLEPDKCFYVEHEAVVRHQEELDLARDPPPDLVVEVDVTSPSRDRLPLYASMGVREVWLWRDEILGFFTLQSTGDYAPVEVSAVLPGFPHAAAQQLLAERRQRDETTLLREFRRRVALP